MNALAALIRLWFLASLLASIICGHVDPQICKSATKLKMLSEWQNPEALSIPSVYVGAVEPENALSEAMPIGKPISVLVYRNLSMGNSDEACSDSELRLSDWFLELAKKKSEPHEIPRWQASMFARVSIVGDISNSRYHRAIRHSAHVVSEIDGGPESGTSFKAYWFQWTPSVQGIFQLTLHVDFLDCKEPLLSLSIPAHHSVDPLKSFCKIIYLPVITIKVTVAHPSRSKPITTFCSLHDMKSGYWLHSALPTDVDAIADSMFGPIFPQSQWIVPQCVTFLHRASHPRDAQEIVMVGDSNSQRVCPGLHRKCKVLGDGVGAMERASFLNDQMNDINIKSFGSFLMECAAGPSVCLVNIGHHAVGLNGTDLLGMLSPVFRRLKIDLAQSDHPSKVIVWSTLASSSKKLDARHNQTLHFLSNFYREYVQNQLLATAVHDTCHDPRYPHSKECSYVDMLSPSSALMDICHGENDPVHMSRGCQVLLNNLIEQVILALSTCAKEKNCQERTYFSTSDNDKYYRGMDASIGNLPTPSCLFTREGACKKYTAQRRRRLGYVRRNV